MSEGCQADGAVPAPLNDEAERGLALLLSVSRGLRSWNAAGAGTQRLLEDLAAPLGQLAAALWLPDRDALVAHSVWGSDVGAALEPDIRRLRLPAGAGLPGRAWMQREPVAVEPGAEERQLRGGPRSAELHGTLALPALAREEVVGVVELYATSTPELGARLMPVLDAVCHHLGAFLDRRRAQLQLSPLTVREVEVLVVAARGLPVSRIAERLTISRGTVKSHLEHIYTKLGVANRTAAVAQALRTGLID
jgi:DNA-binding CsgD family transcriptional regulator